MPPPLTAATGAALLGADARLISQEFRRVLSAPGSTASAAPLRLGFRELLYFQVVNSLTAEGLQLSPGQKREMFRVLTEKPGRHVAQGEWSRDRGELRKMGAVPLSFDLSSVSRELRYRYRLYRRPHVLVESNPAIVSGQPVFRGTRIPVAVVVEQLRSGVSRSDLESDFPQLNSQALDYAQIQARLPKPPGRPRQPLTLQRRSGPNR